MKNLLFLFLFISTLCNAQTSKIDGFWGMKFGSSSSEIKSMMLEKEGCRLITDYDEKEETLTFTGIEYAGEKPTIISYSFFKNKLYSVYINIEPSSESQIFNLYNDFCSKVELKYGSPTLATEKYSYPFEKGDGMEFTAIKTDKLNVSKIWRQTEIVDGKEKYYGKSIMVAIRKDISIYVIYAEEGLMALKDMMNKIKSSKDL